MDIGGIMNVNGSFTVEASLIFPVISFVLITILYIAVYAHEMTCLQSIVNGAQNEVQCLYEDAQYNVRLERGLYIDLNYENSIKQHITAYVMDRSEKALIMTNKERLRVDVDITPYFVYKKIDITISKNFPTPFRYVKELMVGKNINLIKVKAHSHSKLLVPADTIRMVDVMDDLTNNITATKTLKERYEEILTKIEGSINEWI